MQLVSLVLVASRYKGVDESILEAKVDQEVSISDYVVSGGKIAIMLVIDAVTHQLPGVQGHELSVQKDSYVDCLLECPHYTCPEQYWRHQLPKILLAAKSQGDSPLAPLKQALGKATGSAGSQGDDARERGSTGGIPPRTGLGLPVRARNNE